MRSIFRNRTRPVGAVLHRERRGIALFVAMFFVAGVGALALSAIYLTANADLLSKTYEKEDDLKYISEAALQIGKAELNFNPAALPNTSYVQLMINQSMRTADASTVPAIKVNLFVGPSGSTSGQFGRFASVVAEARDANGTGFVRRLELTQESFAKYAYWTNNENQAGGGTIVFGGGDALWGPVWSNDTITIHSTGASFHDAVGTAAPIVSGAGYGTFYKGYQVKQKPILLPTLSVLSSLSGLATASNFNITTTATGDETTVRARLEFVALDLNGDGDSTDTDEGFFRVYKLRGSSGNVNILRADWGGSTSSPPNPSTTYNCGDWHRVNAVGSGLDVELKFFPFAAHYHSGSSNTWYDTVTARGLPGGVTAANVLTMRREADSVSAGGDKFAKVMVTHANVRCYLGGDPHLVSVSRTTGNGWAPAAIHKGGDDTTFTATDPWGDWTTYGGTPAAALSTTKWNAQKNYLFPLYRGYNTNTKGVIYSNGTIGVSGVVRGLVTLYSLHTIVVLDDLRYANDPANGVCLDILGTISADNTVVADNAINTPSPVRTTSNSGGLLYRSLDDTPNFDLHDVVMALGNSFYVEDYDQGPTDALSCGSTDVGRGCLNLTGGLIQNRRGAVGQTTGTGYTKRYSYDRCAIVNPPPYFPTTGRFQDNRYYELDPVRVNSSVSGSIRKLYQSITPGP